ncbi:hypothetical protein ACO0RG_004414 [Hanseniaspora osmophila]|uniref:37S ribosomal protein MRP21, mitochondrial n=1 Tax=Hanseniaspora osmophila TaxID=56408 RepID=A0A1E5RB32_9ASCO|nr:hypothetical protein AWRI3579_g3031 [Hanseniaspora osmophila]
MFALRNQKYLGLVSTFKNQSLLLSTRLFSCSQISMQQGGQGKTGADDVLSNLVKDLNKSTSSSPSASAKFDNILDPSKLQKKKRFTFGSIDNNNPTMFGARGKESFLPTTQTIKRTVDEYHLTGPRAGRTVQVRNGDINMATRQLNRMLNDAKIAQTTMDQRYYIRPSKQKLLKKVRRKKREFSLAFGDLLRTVQEIKRKGY